MEVEREDSSRKGEYGHLSSKGMTLLTKSQKAGLTQRLAFVETELEDLEEFARIGQNIYLSDRKVRRNIDRIAENVLNGCLDMAKVILAGERSSMPGTSREVFLKLGELKILPQAMCSRLADIIPLRNILAHEYLDARWKEIRKFMKSGKKDIRSFLAVVRKRI